MAQFQPGETREKGGFVYERDSSGTWHLKGPSTAAATVPSGGLGMGLARLPAKPDTPPAQTATQAAIDAARLEEIQNPKPSLPAGFRMGPGGVAERVPGLPVDEAEGGLTAAQRNALVERRSGLPGFERQIDEIEALFQQSFDGGEKGGVLGMGGDVNIAGRLPNWVRPENERLTSAADSLIGTIASIQGVTGGEMNSLAEMRARFGPMLPQPTDSDQTIRDKIARLRAMAEDQKKVIAAQLPGSESQPAVAAATTSPPSIGGRDATPQRVIEPESTQAVELSNGGTQRVDDPVLAGVNARINAMLKSGAPVNEIASYVESVGIPAREVMPSLREAERFRRQNPDYRGDWSVNIDDKLLPMGGLRSAIADVSNSPLAAGITAAGDTVLGGRLDEVIGLTGGNAEVAQLGKEALRKLNPLSSLVGDVAGGAMLYAGGSAATSRIPAFAIGAPTTSAFGARAVAGDAALGAYIGSGQNNQDRVGGAIGGALSGVAGGVAGRGAANAFGRAVSPTGGDLAPAYAEGVQPTMGQRMGGIVNRAEQAFASVPGVGGVQRSARNRTIQEWQRGAFNQALREIGSELPPQVSHGKAAHAYMQREFNKAYDSARSGMTFRPDGEFAQDFGAVQQQVGLLSDASQRAFVTLVRRVGNKIQGRGGALNGDDYKIAVSGLASKVRAIRKNPQGDRELADALEQFTAAMDNGARRHSNPEAVTLLDKADAGYAKAVIIEDAARRRGGDAGEFTGKQLDAASQNMSGGIRSRRYLSGNALLQDYAQAGVKLGDTVADSGTPERLMTMGGLAGMAHFVDPTMLAPWAVNTAANLPGVRKVVNAAIAPNRPKLAPVRQKIVDRANLIGLLMGSGAISATAN